MNTDHERLAEHAAKRLRAWYDLADVTHRHAGEAWYADARAFACRLTVEYDHVDRPLTGAQVAGVLAALSPSVVWAMNKRDAERMVRAYSLGMDPATVTVSTYSGQKAKAVQILRVSGGPTTGEVKEILGRRSFKTWAFFDNITDSKSEKVCLDRHIIGAAGIEEQWVQSAVWCYTLVSAAIVDLAHEVDLLPCQVQATIWIAYKEIGDHKNVWERSREKPIPDDTADGIPV